MQVIVVGTAYEGGVETDALQNYYKEFYIVKPFLLK